MGICQVCGFEVVNNRGGQLTNHIKKLHDMSFEDYVVQFQFHGIEPRCACGLCDERPTFNRGKFLSYALNHHHYDERERRHKEKFGIPLCAECGMEVSFQRGIPKKFCSPKCSGKNAGFSLDKTQKKIKETISSRYGVDNVSKLLSVKTAISAKTRGRTGRRHTYTSKSLISKASKDRWKNDETYRLRMTNIEYSHEERSRRSSWIKERNKDLNFRERLFRSCKNRLSKLHQRIRNEMNLDALGFVSEQRVLKYFADELNEEKKIVLEVYGDYPHANPMKYDPDFIIKMPGQSYTAFEKRASDEARRKNIEAAGYRVFIIWESDDIQMKRMELENFLSQCNI